MNKTKSLLLFVIISTLMSLASFAQNRILSDAGEGIIQRFDGLSMDSAKIMADLLATTIAKAYAAFEEMEAIEIVKISDTKKGLCGEIK